MLMKEYRICLPMSVEEYRIAQLYMIQKKSREESSGTESGVEILVNEPYEDGPGGSGQYTHKLYHIGSHLPGWFRAILPKSALVVEEEAWNAYPYTRTIYRCPFIDKFTLFIETRYLDEGGEVENIFDLNKSELRARTVDFIDIVKDPVSTGDYSEEEDPCLFVSQKTGRGPLSENWRQEYIDAAKGSNPDEKKIMCSYKLCKVEFRYWGMQSKIERFIHDVGLRKTMVRAHRQAWTWQDEYHGLTMADIRELERQTQEALREKFGDAQNPEGDEQTNQVANSTSQSNSLTHTNLDTESKGSQSNISIATLTSSTANIAENDMSSSYSGENKHLSDISRKQLSPGTSHKSVSSDNVSKSEMDENKRRPISSIGSMSRESMIKRNLVVDDTTARRLGSIEALYSSEEDEFFDAIDNLEEAKIPKSNIRLSRSSSLDLLTSAGANQSSQDETDGPKAKPYAGDSYDTQVNDTGQRDGQNNSSLLFLVVHGGSIVESGAEIELSKFTDISCLKATFNQLISAHYTSLQGRVAIKLVSCPFICASTLHLLSSLYPGNFDASATNNSENIPIAKFENMPLSAVPLFATGSTEYTDAVIATVARLNAVYADFLSSPEGRGFNGQVCIIADSVGSIISYDALCKSGPYTSQLSGSNHGSTDGLHETDQSDSDTGPRGFGLEPIRQVSLSNPDLTVTDASPDQLRSGPIENENPRTRDHQPTSKQNLPARSQSNSPSAGYREAASCPNSRRTSSGSQDQCATGNNSVYKLRFDVTDFFMFGSPLALVLAYRKMSGLSPDMKNTPSPQYLDPFWALLDSKLNREQHSATLPRPCCQHMYNLFYPNDPSAHRLEPLVLEKFKHISPVKIARYAKFPLGDGWPLHVVETIQSNMTLFRDVSAPPSPRVDVSNDNQRIYERRISNLSVSSQWSGHWDHDIANLTQLTNRWWGTKRLDFALYSPEAVVNLPHQVVPFILHSSFWESKDVVAFILRQVVRQDQVERGDVMGDSGFFTPSQPRERWQRRRTTMKLRGAKKAKNLAPNHRGNDVIVLEDREQVVSAKFMYGPLDMVSLNGEKVDIHIMRNPPNGDWTYHGTDHTDSAGRLSFTIPEEKRLSQGMYPVKMVVRGDHTAADLYLAVLPPRTEAVVFSIDGSFTASMSITGGDPKVRPAAVDCVRYWQELGYMLLYVTGRPDLQHKKVIAWLAQHNFPHGMVAFMDGLSADPLKQKLLYLRHLQQEADIKVRYAYGSAKDVSVYQQLGLKPEQIFLVGKATKKQFKEAIVLAKGYASHLEDLHAGTIRAATGNARFFLRKSCFSLPAQSVKSFKKTSVRKTLSMPGHNIPGIKRTGSSKHLGATSGKSIATGVVGTSEHGNTVLDPRCAGAGAVKARGVSPRLHITQATPRKESKA